MAFPNPVTLAVPAFVALVVLEWWRIRRKRPYDARDAACSVALGAGSLVVGLLAGGAVTAAFGWAHAHRIAHVPLAWWAFALCFVLDDLAYYVFHRCAHRVRWIWASHGVHHSSTAYNLTTALRQTWTGVVSLSFAFRLPLVLVGFPPELVLFCGALNLVYQFWIHTELVGRMPRWFEAVMNTPSHHRVHHAVNPRYLDRNYAGVFIVWDRLFGTFEAERADDPPRYGLVRQLETKNPVRAAFHEWIGLARSIAHWPRHALRLAVKPPGWTPEGDGDTADAIRARWLASGGEDDSALIRMTTMRQHLGET